MWRFTTTTPDWEDRIMYRDSKNAPAAGPDGAFGQSMLHNDRGQITRVLSLDRSGNAMVDNTGNSGMQVKSRWERT